ARLPMYGVVIAAFFSDAAGAPAWVGALVYFCMYLLGILVAPLVALLLKTTLLRGETPPFVMEMPVYKRPAVGTVLRRVGEAGWEFLRRAGTIIVAAMIVVWALLYFPNGQEYEKKIAELREEKQQLDEAEKKDEAEEGDLRGGPELPGAAVPGGVAAGGVLRAGLLCSVEVGGDQARYALLALAAVHLRLHAPRGLRGALVTYQVGTWISA